MMRREEEEAEEADEREEEDEEEVEEEEEEEGEDGCPGRGFHYTGGWGLTLASACVDPAVCLAEARRRDAAASCRASPLPAGGEASESESAWVWLSSSSTTSSPPPLAAAGLAGGLALPPAPPRAAPSSPIEAISCRPVCVERQATLMAWTRARARLSERL